MISFKSLLRPFRSSLWPWNKEVQPVAPTNEEVIKQLTDQKVENSFIWEAPMERSGRTFGVPQDHKIPLERPALIRPGRSLNEEEKLAVAIGRVLKADIPKELVEREKGYRKPKKKEFAVTPSQIVRS